MLQIEKMMEIEDIANRVFNKSKEKEMDFYDVWDLLNHEYGFIPLEVLLNMELIHIEKLIEKINERYKAINKNVR